jgi:L-malate glycosyltransferase
VDESAGNPLPKNGKLRVAIVAPSLRILGGHSVQAQTLLEGWSRDSDVDAWLVPINPAPAGPLGLLLKVKYLRTLVTQLIYWPLLFRELRRADVVHIFSASYASFLLSPLPAALVARILRRPVVLNYHSGEADDHLRKSAIARSAIARADSVVVPSRYLVEVFAALGFNAAAVPNVVDHNRFKFRERYPLQPKILSTRNFEGLYNVACTLRAFKLVQKSWPNAQLTLVGSGPLEGELRALVSELQLEHVTFAGRVAPDRMAEYYADHDIYVQSPNLDNMPVSVLEAYASGLPVVSTEAGGVPAILADGEDGLLAPLDDAPGLAARILLLLEQPGVARDMAHHARARCEQFSWPCVRDQWLSHYRQACRIGEREPAGTLGFSAGAK